MITLSSRFSEVATFVDLVRWRALRQPDQVACRFLADGDDEGATLTYAELDEQARRIAALLQSMGTQGERALLLYPPGLEYITAFLGCLYAAVIAVPAYLPVSRILSRIQSIATDAGATIALTTDWMLTRLERVFAGAPEFKTLQWLSTSQVESGWEDLWREPALSSDPLAFIQYTSGSTSTPRGVMVSHGNLMHHYGVLASLDKIPRGSEPRSTRYSRAVSWLPPYHDMGLTSVLFPMYWGSSLVWMAPESFLQRPVRWLRAISRYKGTFSAAPNFAYDVCVRKVTSEERATLDLSSWEIAICGAEPVRKDTLERFVECFGPCGFRRKAFYPCYGLAEATLMVSSAREAGAQVEKTFETAALAENRLVETVAGTKGARTLMGCGQTLPEQQVVIVHPETLTPCRSGQIGEIWVSGGSIAKGYWKRPEETERTFRACLADTGEGPFLRTGDLGSIYDGELFVTGRVKDLIIIRGCNHYPHDIEQTVEQSHPALRPGGGAAFSVDVDGEERLVIVQEVQLSPDLDVQGLIGAIRRTVTEQHGLQVYSVVLTRPGSIPKTSSGKIRRHVCQAQFQAGQLTALAEWKAVLLSEGTTPDSARRDLGEPEHSPPEPRTEQEIKAWLVRELSDRLHMNRDEVDTSEPFSSYGLDSNQAVSLAGDMEVWLGRSLPAILAYEYPTVDSLARHLAGNATAHESMPTSDADRSIEDDEIERLLGTLERLSEDDARAALVTQKGEAMANERAV
jgi:acyl-CoA synthetase (AMP-forming)/AMP-acid ligase II/acyl carrier protein